MNHLGTMYATKRRRRNIKRNQPKDGQTKTNPSKRHRERLNAELDLLASLLPFEQSVLSKLDKLSILRLSVSYLRTKSYFQCILNKEREACAITNVLNHSNSSNSSNSNISNSSSHLAHLSHQLNNLQTANASTIQQTATFQSNGQLIPYNQHLAHNAAQLKYNREYIENLLEGDLILQALNGFLFIITCDGVVFYISNTVETYLGYPQSDVCHQSVYDLVHSEDREELQRHLNWTSSLPNDKTNMTLNEALRTENSQYLERNFTVRFRCLLDNTSGFLRLEIRGRIKVLHGQNLKQLDDNNYNQSTPLALFAVCTPFGPPSLLEMPSKENLFKSKHRLDFSWIQLDARGRQLLGYNETDLVNRSCYDLVHYDDLSYVSSAHQELIKTGASGLIAYRLCTKNTESWQWLQTSARLIYKNSKADFILCTHRPLMEEEGRDLYGKRTMDFKVTYLDGGLGAMSTDRNFDCLTGEKNVDDRSTIVNNSSSSTKSNKTRRIKAEKNTQQNLKNSILNHHPTSLTTAAAAFAAINSSINPNNLTNTNNYEHALNYSNNQTNNLAQPNRYNNTAGLTGIDYYGNHSTAYANAYANTTTGYPNYNAQTNVTIINNNYNLNVTPQSNSALNNSTAMQHLPATTGNNITANTLLNENSSCSSNSSFSSCSTALIRKKFINQSNSNEDYDQFNQLINGHNNSHVFHSATTPNQQQPNNNHQQTHHHHLNNTNHLNLNLNQLTSINQLNQLNQNTILNNSFNTNSNNFNGFIYSPPHQQNLSPNNETQLNTTTNTTNSIINNQSHNQQFSSPSSTPVHLNHDQTNQLSPLSTASNSNQLEQQQVVINMDTSNSTTHQTLNHHLNSSNSMNDLVGSPQTTANIVSNPATSPSNSSSSINTNLSINSSTSPAQQSTVALPLPYNVANHAPHHFLHYSRLSTYYPEYHLYNYFEPKFKNTVSNNLIGNNLISNNNLFNNEHNLFINNSSTNVF